LQQNDFVVAILAIHILNTFFLRQSLFNMEKSTANLNDLVQYSKLEPHQVSKMICLPSVARHQGVCLHCFNDTSSSSTDSNRFLTQLFDSIGGVVTVDSEHDLQACMMTTCTMGPLYGMMTQSRDWLLQSTTSLSKEEVSYLVIKQLVGSILDSDRVEVTNLTSKTDPNRLETMIQEQTPGGLVCHCSLFIKKNIAPFQPQ
jgi:pyrroline-5-carboxylate reductase